LGRDFHRQKLVSLVGHRAISFAAAASCLKHSMHGDFNHATVVEVEALMNGGGGGRIQR
jgi:2-dehydro-3-deoxygluconokinase